LSSLSAKYWTLDLYVRSDAKTQLQSWPSNDWIFVVGPEQANGTIALSWLLVQSRDTPQSRQFSGANAPV